MRLMCPNCDAEYEVDASAIPDSGRDVQCSNCGHAWFQQHPEFEAEQEAEAALYDPPPPLAPPPRQSTPPVIQSAPEVPSIPPMPPGEADWNTDDPEAILDALGAADGDDTAQDTSGAVQETVPSDAEVNRPEIGADAMRILREEAEFERAQRQAERAAPDPLADDPLADDPAVGATAEPSVGALTPVVARRVARLKGIQPPAAPVAPPPARDRLPKVEAVSAKLRAAEAMRADPSDPKPRSGAGRIGFWAAIGMMATAAGAYVLSPVLAGQFPKIAAPLAEYVGLINTGRDGLDQMLPKIGAALSALVALVQGWF